MARSATGVTVVITGGVTLLVGVGSLVGELTLAVLVSEPLAGAVTVTVTLPACTLPTPDHDQLTRPAELAPLPLALTKETPAGNESVTTMLLAVEGPLLVTV